MMDSKKAIQCECGANTIELTFHHSMPPELVDKVFCPKCEKNGFNNPKSWPIPGNWHLHFDLEIARMFAMAKLKIDPLLVNPGFIIDGGYVE